MALLIYAVIIVMLIVEFMLVAYFNTTFYPTMFNILTEASPSECLEFIATYFNIESLLYILIILATTFFIIKTIPIIISKIPKKILFSFVIITSIIAVVRFGGGAYTFIRHRTGQSIPQYSSILRLVHSYYVYLQTTSENDRLISNLKSCKILENNARCNIMIVVIGESHSKYHSQIYGYNKPTMPKLNKRATNGELIIFTDVITPANGTSGSVRSIFSLSETATSRYSDYELFPYIFKQAGYYSLYADNQHLATISNNVIESKALSNEMFDKRNDSLFKYDMELFEWVKTQQGPEKNHLIILKIQGQHYTYEYRFPKEWAFFCASDYDHTGLSQDKKQILAHYDNATIYNDYFIDSIISYFEKDNAVLVYMSDHGEEIYDYRDYIGHGGRPSQLKYQIEIPFFIWMSDSYKKYNSQIATNIQQNSDKPYSTDDVAHLLLDMAGIKTTQFAPTRSIANNAFYPKDKRIVMNSIIYEDIKK